MAKVPSSIRKISMNIMYFTCYNQIYKKWHGFPYLNTCFYRLYGYQCNDVVFIRSKFELIVMVCGV